MKSLQTIFFRGRPPIPMASRPFVGVRIGVDVGGTNTDTVLFDGPTVLHQAKVPTTADVTGGVVAAIQRLGLTLEEITRVEVAFCGSMGPRGPVFAALDDAEVRAAFQKIKEKHIREVVVSSCFSVLNPEQEKQEKELAALLPMIAADPQPYPLSITTSPQIRGIRLLEREDRGVPGGRGGGQHLTGTHSPSTS